MSSLQAAKPLGRPASATHFVVPLLGFVSFIFVALWIKPLAQSQPELATIYLVLGLGIPMALAEILFGKPYLNAYAALIPLSQSNPRSMARVIQKLVGFYGVLGLCAFAYWMFPLYRDSLYQRGYRIFQAVFEWILILPPIYFYWMDGKMKSPEDGYGHFGRLLLFTKNPDGSPRNWKVIREFLRGWLVKAFFVPLMVSYLVGSVSWFGRASLEFPEFKKFYEFCYDLIFLVDVGFCVVGYVFTMRLFDSQIRSAEPTFLGWMVALACYSPFYDGTTSRYLKYDDHLYWGGLFEANSVPYIMWGSTILILLSTYSWATVMFGFRFSNLTYRGIITGGPYRWTKHPAYVTKNTSWWLISVPFISSASPFEAFRQSLLLLLLNGIYFLRARTEEAHLSKDPDYVAYAEYINEKGAFAWLGRRVPFFKYRQPLA